MSEAQSFNSLTPLVRGETDPLYMGHSRYRYCAMEAPNSGFVCTRPAGHVGLHVATSYGHVCCDAWGLTLQQCLPEGF